jgi:hypothetical protein
VDVVVVVVVADEGRVMRVCTMGRFAVDTAGKGGMIAADDRVGRAMMGCGSWRGRAMTAAGRAVGSISAGVGGGMLRERRGGERGRREERHCCDLNFGGEEHGTAGG